MTQEATFPQDYLNSEDNEYSQGPHPWAHLVATNADHPGDNLIEDEVIIGRRSQSTIHVNHPAVSGEHCKIQRRDGMAFICDTSRNGTTVNKVMLHKEERLLEDGSEITLVPPRPGIKKISFMIHFVKRKPKLLEGVNLKYVIKGELGSGAFAQVKLCISRKTGQKYAIKIIDKNKFKLKNHSSRPNALKDEVKILQKLEHENIIRIHEVFEDDSLLQLVLELVEGGDLFDAIIGYHEKHNRGFSEDKARNIFKQLVAGVEYMHSKKVAHRDLKPENILLKDKTSDIVKITDFGLSRFLGDGSYLKTLCGTPMYLAPEVLPDSKGNPSQYDFKCDLWSLGAILYVMLSGCAPFDESNKKLRLLDQVRQGKYNFPKDSFSHVGEDAKDLIKKLLCIDPDARYTIPQVKSHRWMKDIKEDRVGTKRKDASESAQGGKRQRK